MELKNGNEMLVGYKRYLVTDQNSQNIVLIHVSRTAWPKF